MRANNPVSSRGSGHPNQADNEERCSKAASCTPCVAEVIRGRYLADADACIGVAHTDRSRARCTSGRWILTPGGITSPGICGVDRPPSTLTMPLSRHTRPFGVVIDPPRLDPFPGVSQGDGTAGR